MAMPAIEIQPQSKRAPRLTKWVAQKWKPIYEQMVVLHVLGKTNKEIGLQLGYTKEHVSNVLNLEQAEQLIERLKEKLRENTMSLPDTLQYIAEKTAQRLRTVVDNDAQFEKTPFAVIDRGLDVLKGLGHLKGGGNGSTTINAGTAVILPTQIADRLLTGMEKADEARRLNPANEIKPV